MTIDVTEHIPLVHWVIDRYYTRRISGRIEREDLVSEGCLGLMKAAEKFDPERGFAFSTYAVHWVRNYIYRYMQNHGRLVRVPIYLQDGERGKQLRPEALKWLDAPYGRDSERTHHDFLGSDDPGQSRALATEDIEMLMAVIKDKRARLAVRQWYLKDRTLEEIALNVGGVSRERVRQLVLEGLEDMRRHVQGLGPRVRSQTVMTEEQREASRERMVAYNERRRFRSTDNNFVRHQPTPSERVGGISTGSMGEEGLEIVCSVAGACSYSPSSLQYDEEGGEDCRRVEGSGQ